MSELASLRKRRRLTLLAFGLASIFIFSGFVYGPTGTDRTAFSLVGNDTWDAAALANVEMSWNNHDVTLFIGPEWDTEGGNVLAFPVLRELAERHDTVMGDYETSKHFAPIYQWQVQGHTRGPWGFAETVRAVMNQETPVSQQIGWNGSDFNSSTQEELDDVLSRLFSYQLPDGSKPYFQSVSYLEQQEDGSWDGRAFFIWGIANTSSLFGKQGEYSRTPGMEKPFIEEWELLIDEVYVKPMSDTGEEVHVWSFLGLDTQVDDQVNKTIPLIGVSFVLMAIILGLFFRDWRDVLAAASGLGLLMGWMVGTQAWLGYPQTQISSMLPILLLALGVDFSFHGLVRWRAIAHRDGGDEEVRLAAAWTSIRELSPALGLATVTTMIAFGTASFSPIQDLAEWGRLAAIFIPQAYLLLGIFTVVLRSGHAVHSGEIQKGFADRMRALGAVQVRKPIPFLIALLLLTGSAVAIGQPDSDFEVHDYLDGNSRMVQSLDTSILAFDESDQGEPGFILVQAGDSSDLADYNTLVQLDGLMADIRANNWTYDTPTIIDAIRMQIALVNAGGGGYNATTINATTGIPEDSNELQKILVDISANGTMNPNDPRFTAAVEGVATAVESVAPIAVIDGTSGRLSMLKLPIKVEKAGDWAWMAQYKVDVEQLMDENLNFTNGEKATFTGVSYQRYVYVNAMTDSFQKSIYIAIVACLAVLYIVFRDIRLSLLTIIPVVAVSLWLYAGINLAGQSLNIVTLQVASLAIGLGLDYAIHVTQAIREQKRRRPDEGMARWVQGMMGHTGTALFASGFTDILGFGVLLLAAMPMFTMFGKVMIAMVVLAQAACVFILPALLTMFGGLESDTSESSG
ncbi:MAG TPA: hypothetical protein EYO22_03565 [Candidatus Poseidoniales archaeon]|nr:hypothetical protein [Candidatus Poseidoniales archaeon]